MEKMIEIQTHQIYKIYQKSVSIGVKHGSDPHKLLTINIPITNDVYALLLLNTSNNRLATNYPLIFFVDGNGTATNVLPLHIWNKMKAEQNKKAQDFKQKTKAETKKK